MAGAARLFLIAVVFLLPGGSLALAAYAARLALRQRAWIPVRRDPPPVRPPR